MNKLPVYRDHPCKDGNDIIFRVGYARLSDFAGSGIIFHLGFGPRNLSSLVSGRIFADFKFCGFGFEDNFSLTVSSSGPRNLLGSVSDSVFPPWIPNE